MMKLITVSDHMEHVPFNIKWLASSSAIYQKETNQAALQKKSATWMSFKYIRQAIAICKMLMPFD